MISIIIGGMMPSAPSYQNDARTGYEKMHLEQISAREMKRREEPQRTQIRADEDNKSFTARMKTYGRPDSNSRD